MAGFKMFETTVWRSLFAWKICNDKWNVAKTSILVNFILNITKRPDVHVTSGKPRENYMACALFANLVEWQIWQGRTLYLNYSRKYCFRFPRYDCGIWRWIGRPDCSSISFYSSTESQLHKDPASLISLLLVVLFNGKLLVVGFIWDPLWSVIDLRKC